nr:uncharacterized protein LOC109421601 [Aedes albopictus]
MEELVLELKFIVPNAQSKMRILELWEKTFENRQQLRKSESLLEYFNDFPVIGAFDGELIKLEFLKIKPEAKPFKDHWDEIQDKILDHYTNMCVELKDKFIRALAIIRAKCPSRGSKRNKNVDTNKKNPLSGVIEWINSEDDFPTNVNSPVLICRGPFLEGTTDSAVCWGSTVINVPTGLQSAFKVLFCSFAVIGVEPPQQDKQFFAFVAGAVLGLPGMSTTCEKFLVSLD